MALFKSVDGVRIEMTFEEEAQIRAEWAANLARPPVDPIDTWLESDIYAKLMLEEVCKAASISFEQIKAAVKARVRIQ